MSSLKLLAFPLRSVTPPMSRDCRGSSITVGTTWTASQDPRARSALLPGDIAETMTSISLVRNSCRLLILIVVVIIILCGREMGRKKLRTIVIRLAND
jgi:hypothetical protein